MPDSSAPPARAVLPFAAAIVLSSSLLFLVQPLIAKQVLPWFGGSAAVWGTCLVFFQTALLGGYGYADLLRRFGPRTQTRIHVALLALSLLTLPVLAPESAKPTPDGEPTWQILVLLGRAVGLPYFLLSTTTPLLQSWYWQRNRTAVPYRLYALSNLASLAALLAFPVALEPWFGMRQLAVGWSAAYAVFAVACAWLAWPVLTGAQLAHPQPEGQTAGSPPPTKRQQLQWLVASAMGSVMLLGVSHHITQNVASVPFLWVAPLSLYLLTFVVCFDRPQWVPRVPMAGLTLVAAAAMAWQTESLNLKIALPLYLGGLLAACLYCHGELARTKPAPAHLTRFYLMLSLGGALGSVLVALVAPAVLSGDFELLIALVLLSALASFGLPSWVKVAGAAATVLTAALGWQAADNFSSSVRVMKRDFFGTVRTRDKTGWGSHYRVMIHGAIKHGGQILDPAHQREPSDYFGPGSGYGRTFAALNDLQPAPRKVGIIGLGAGVAGGYLRKGDDLTFYEISPAVVQAESAEFTFRLQTPATQRLVMGDGRLSLEREPPQGYDLLGIDAFSGDSIPMHLVTREAFALYLRHLKPDGVLVFQATNRYIDLLPLLQRHAAEHGLVARSVYHTPSRGQDYTYWQETTLQVVMTRNRALFDHPRFAGTAQPIADRADLATFTDDYHNLFRILK